MRFAFCDVRGGTPSGGRFHQPNVNSWLTQSIEIELIKRLIDFSARPGAVARPPQIALIGRQALRARGPIDRRKIRNGRAAR
jgi:hypothetical protein